MVKRSLLHMTLLGLFLAAVAPKMFAAGFSGNFSQLTGAAYDSGYDDRGLAVAVDTATAGGPYAYVVGQTSCTGNADIMITKYDGATGTRLLSAVFNSSTPAYGTGVAVDGAGSVYVTGYTELPGYYGSVLVKLKCDGESVVVLSSAAYTDGSFFRFYGVAVRGNDVFVAGGSGKNADGALLRYNSDLVFLSSTSLHGICEGVAVDRTGDIVAAHYALNDETTVSRFDSSLALLSSTTVTGPGTGNSTAAHAIAVDGSNNVFVAGYCADVSHQGFILKFNSGLALVSSATYASSGPDGCGYGVAIDSACCVYVSGSAHNGQNVDALLLKYDNDLVLLSSHTYDAGNHEYGGGIAVDQYNAVYFTGYAMNSAGNYDCRTVKYSPCQPTLTWTGEPGYTAGGVYPDNAQTGPFVFRVTYTDPNNIPPASGYPAVYIVYKNESIILCSMTEADTGDTDYTDGKIYTYTYNNLPARDQNYRYLLQAKNKNNYPANGPASMMQTGPTVSGIFSGSFALPGGAVYDGGAYDEATAIAVDETQKQVLVAGSMYNSSIYADYFVLRYNADGQKRDCVTFDRGSLDYAYGLWACPGGDIYVTGTSFSSTTLDCVTLDYDQYFQLRSSSTFDSGRHDVGYDVARDTAGNVFVCGYYENGVNKDAFLLKYGNPGMVFLSSVTFDSGNNDLFNKLAVDPSNRIFAAGVVSNGSGYDCIIRKYDNDLVLMSSAVFKSGPDDRAYAIIADSTGNVYAAGYFNSGVDYDWFVVKYSNNLVLLASTTFNSGALDSAAGLAFDPGGDLYVSGNAGTNVVMTRLYDRNLVFISSVTYTSGNNNYCAGVAADNEGHIFIACKSLNGNGNYDFRTIRYSSSAFCGAEKVSDPNITSGTIAPDAAFELVISPVSGEIRVAGPARSFSGPVALSISTTVPPAADRATVKVTGIGFEITGGGLQPAKDITITVHYRDADIADFEEAKLAVAYYDEAHSRWVVLPSTVYPEENKVVGRTRHLSMFALVQLAPAAGLSSVIAYPNPFNPARQANMTVDNLPAAAGLKIYTITGELVRMLDYAGATGRAYWDGKNDGGVRVASGVYLLLIKDGAGDKKLKIAVEK